MRGNLQGYTALYGGSFDPPHMGHQMACLYLLQALAAQSVWLVPTGQHAFGKALIPFRHRRAMCERLAAPFGGQVLVNDVEEQQGGTSYTIDTVTALHERHPELKFAMVIGADVVADLPRWHRAQELVQMCPLVVIGRAGVVAPATVTVGSTMLFIDAPQLDMPEISSRSLRAALGESDYTAAVDRKMPQGVAQYIETHGLYQGG